MGLLPGTNIEYIGGGCRAAAVSHDERCRTRNRDCLFTFKDR